MTGRNSPTCGLLFGYMFGHPGKKLHFMGSELGQRRRILGRWFSVDWSLEKSPSHRGIQRLLSRPKSPAHDASARCMKWTSNGAGSNGSMSTTPPSSVLSFLRRARNPEDVIVVVCNFTPVVRENYRVGVPRPGYLPRDSEHRLHVLRRHGRRQFRRRPRRAHSVERPALLDQAASCARSPSCISNLSAI